jgi:hypothetical protein
VSLLLWPGSGVGRRVAKLMVGSTAYGQAYKAGASGESSPEGNIVDAFHPSTHKTDVSRTFEAIWLGSMIDCTKSRLSTVATANTCQSRSVPMVRKADACGEPRTLSIASPRFHIPHF